MPSNIHRQQKKVFALWWPSTSRSWYNESTEASDWYSAHPNNPDSASLPQYQGMGGWFRGRPIFRAASNSPTWKIDDRKFDIVTAFNAGIDGFFADIVSRNSYNFDRLLEMQQALRELRAADSRYNSFYLIPMADASNSLTSTPFFPISDAGAFIASFSDLSWYVNGNMVWSSFRPENTYGLNVGETALSYSQSMKDYLANTASIPNYYLPVFLNNFSTNATTFSDITWGESAWEEGIADPAAITASTNYVDLTRTRGKIHMTPIRFQEVRPKDGWAAEAANSECLRASWEKAINDDADIAHIVTFTDWTETAMAPSTHHGWCPLDVSAYYSVRFKTGSFPDITRDVVYLSHRDNPTTSTPTYSGLTQTMVQRPSSGVRTLFQDTIEALTFLKAPATVRVTTAEGSTDFSASAGMNAYSVPLAVGTAPRVDIIRELNIICSVISTRNITDYPYVDDKQYWWFSSERGTIGQERHPGPQPVYP